MYIIITILVMNFVLSSLKFRVCSYCHHLKGLQNTLANPLPSYCALFFLNRNNHAFKTYKHTAINIMLTLMCRGCMEKCYYSTEVNDKIISVLWRSSLSFYQQRPSLSHIGARAMDLVYWMIGMSRFKPLHERRPSIGHWIKLKLKTCHWSVQKGQLFFYKEGASFTGTWW